MCALNLRGLSDFPQLLTLWIYTGSQGCKCVIKTHTHTLAVPGSAYIWISNLKSLNEGSFLYIIPYLSCGRTEWRILLGLMEAKSNLSAPKVKASFKP